MATTLKIGLVNIPIMLVNYVNNRYSTSGLHQFSKCCNEAVGNKKYCKGCGEEVLSCDILKGFDKDSILSEEQQENLKEYLDNGVMEVISIKEFDIENIMELIPYIQKTQLILPSISKAYKKTDVKIFYSFVNALRESNKVCYVKYVGRGLEHLGFLSFNNDDLLFSEVPFKAYDNTEDLIRIKEGVNNTIRVDKINDLDLHKEQANKFISTFKNKIEELDLVKEEKVILLKQYVEEIRNGGVKPTTIKKEVEINPFGV